MRLRFDFPTMRLRFFFSLLIGCLSCSIMAMARVSCPTQGPKLTAEQYCKLYAEEAQNQMKRYGIPASITLAQGMFESAYGSSYLAVKANNHFGIKAYRGWNGPVVRCDDDAANEPFCKFKSVKDGYEYHSTFLRSNPRYAPLFKLDARDYEAWAHGLKKCGYATNPKYAERLIEIIDRYHLDVYDLAKGKKIVANTHTVYKTTKKRGLRYIKVRKGDDLALIALEFNMSKRKLRKWNDLPKNYQLHEGEIIYLQAKNTKASKNYKVHTVSEGESLQSVAQRYGVTVKSLMKRNELSSGVITVGQQLKLR